MKNTASHSDKNVAEKPNHKAEKHNRSHSKNKTAEGLYDLLVHQLKDMYWAEKALIKALPKLIKKSTAHGLTEALSTQLEVTKEQVTRLEVVFSVLDEKADGKKCAAMEGLINESEDLLDFTDSGIVRDAGIICASQKIAHYGIATYGTLAAFARTLGEEAATALLQESLDEEKEADLMLSVIAESHINAEAADVDDEGPEDVGLDLLLPDKLKNKHQHADKI